MKKIRLLAISPVCEIGGSELNLLRLLRKLDRNEYEILLLVPYNGSLADEFRREGFQVEILDMPRIRRFINPFMYIMILLKFIPTVLRLKNIIQGRRIDIVCTSSMVSPYGALAAKLAKRPHILIAVEYLSVLRLTIPYFYLLSDKIICCSNLVKSMFKDSPKVSVFYPGLNLDEFSPSVEAEALREKLSIRGRLVSMIARLAPWKGVEVFIKAAKYTDNNVTFVIFGQTVMGKEKYLEKLKKMIERLGLGNKVILSLEYKYRDIPQVLAASDIAVHASLRPEPFGLTVIESMATGKPVIASKLGGPAEIISDGIDGLLVEPGKPRDLALSISALLDNPAMAKEMGIKAREKAVKNFDIKNYAKYFDSIFKSTHNGCLPTRV